MQGTWTETYFFWKVIGQGVSVTLVAIVAVVIAVAWAMDRVENWRGRGVNHRDSPGRRPRKIP